MAHHAYDFKTQPLDLLEIERLARKQQAQAISDMARVLRNKIASLLRRTPVSQSV